MSLYVYVVVVFGAILLGWTVTWYLRTSHNNLVDARESCEKAWGDVEVLLQRRYDEVGNLVDLAGEYLSTEREILDEIIDARERAIAANTPEETATAGVIVGQAVGEFYAIADEYPELRADAKFDDVRESLTEVEQRLENRREHYNETVRRYNALLEKVPETFVAERRGFEPREPFQASDRAREEFSISERLDASA